MVLVDGMHAASKIQVKSEVHSTLVPGRVGMCRQFRVNSPKTRPPAAHSRGAQRRA